jgi:hypothetical protein
MLADFTRSGLTRGEFCARYGLPLSTFDYWRRELRGKRRLVKVEIARPQPASFTLHLVNGRSIESSFGFAEEELAQLIRIAERA